MKNTKSLLLTAVSVIALSSTPALFAQEQERHDDARPQAAEHRDADDHHGREYHFRDEDAPRLRQYYRNVEKVDVTHREAIVAGGRLPADWHRHIRPVPAAVIRELAPPPDGYVFGYYNGYCVVYDPATGIIADVVDLAKMGR